MMSQVTGLHTTHFVQSHTTDEVLLLVYHYYYTIIILIQNNTGLS